jgi:RNA polymerase sigma factor (sigma-70 family)
VADGEDGEERKGSRRKTLPERLEALVGIRRHLEPPEIEELRAVFALLYQAHFPRVWKQLGTRGLDRATAEDLTQVTFEKLRRAIIKRGFPADIGPYVEKIARRALIDHLRGQRNSPITSRVLSSGSAPPVSSEEVDRDEDLEELRRIFREKLSDDQIAVAELCILSRLTVREATWILESKQGTVATRLRRVKEVIGELMPRWVPPSKRRPNG